MEREISSSNRSSCGGAGEPSSSGEEANAHVHHVRESVASSSVAAVAGEEANAHVHHVRESAGEDDEDDEDVKWRNMEAVVDQLLFLIKKSTHKSQGNDGCNSQNNIPTDNSTAGGSGGGGGGDGCGSGGEVIMKDGFNEPANINIVASGVAEAGAVVTVDAIIPACNETVSDEKKEKSSKKKRSPGSSSSAHTCEVCGKTFAKGQSLGGHKRKHYDIQKIIDNKRRAREKQKETPAPAVERTVQEPPEGQSAANVVARRPHDFDLNEPAAPEEEEERENAPQPETERKDNDADDLLSFRLWPKFDSQDI